jgi:hypothetical protein
LGREDAREKGNNKMNELGKTDYGYRWGFTFLNTDTLMTDDERLELVVEATEMFFNNEKERKVKGETYEGIIRTDFKYHVLGTFGGREYDALIDIGDRRAYLSFLVKEFIDPTKN